jgi:predicted dehydrogenase
MAEKRHLNIALIGQGFMGRTHSNAWSQVKRFFKPPVVPVMHTSCGIPQEEPQVFADKWGWQNVSTDWEATVRSPAIDLVDVVTPNCMHAAVAKAALAAGKPVASEKPLSDNLADARTMAELARKAKVPTFVWYNYRRCPAVAYAHKMARAGALGTIRHVRAFYLQDWADESVPLIWRFQKEVAGSGSHGDLAAHIIDMTRFVTGEEITEVYGAVFETFIKQRAVLTKVSGGGIAGGTQGDARAMAPVTVDDAVLFICRFAGGAVAHFEATRLATGNQNRNGFEINGTKGSLKFNFERMNELEYFDATGPRGTQGWRTIMCTHAPDHPYAEAWWPDAHGIGYEHAFTNMAADILRVLGGQEPAVPIPDFEDALKTQRVLEAVALLAQQKHCIRLDQVK